MPVDTEDDLLAGLDLDAAPLDTDLTDPASADVEELDERGQPKPKPAVPADQAAEIAKLRAEIAAAKARQEGRDDAGGEIAKLREDLAELRGRQATLPAAPQYTPEQLREFNEKAVTRLSTEPVKVFDEFAAHMTESIMAKVRAEFGALAGGALAVGGDVAVDRFITRKVRDLTPKMAAAVEAEFQAGLADLDPSDLVRKSKTEREKLLEREYDAALGRYTAKSLAKRGATATPSNLSGGGGTAATPGKGSLLKQCSEALGYDAEETRKYARNVGARAIRDAEAAARAAKKPFTDADRDAAALAVLADYLDIRKAS